MNIKKSVVLSILLLLGNVQKSSAGSLNAFSCGAVGILLTVGLQKLIYTFWWTTEKEFNDLVAASSVENNDNLKHEIDHLVHHAEEIKEMVDKDTQQKIMAEAIACTKASSTTRNAKFLKACIEEAHKVIKHRREIAEKHGSR